MPPGIDVLQASEIRYLFRALPNWEEAHATTRRPSSSDPARHRDAVRSRSDRVRRSGSVRPNRDGRVGRVAGPEHRARHRVAAADLDARLRDGPWLPVATTTAAPSEPRSSALLQTGACPNVFYSTNMKTCFGSMDTVGADTVPEFSVPWWFRTDFVAHRAALGGRSHREPDRQRGRRAGRRVGQRQRGGDAGHRRRATTPGTRSTSPACCARREHARARGLPEQPEHDVHARQRRLDPDPAGQQHRHPVPDPAATPARWR